MDSAESFLLVRIDRRPNIDVPPTPSSIRSVPAFQGRLIPSLPGTRAQYHGSGNVVTLVG